MFFINIGGVLLFCALIGIYEAQNSDIYYKRFTSTEKIYTGTTDPQNNMVYPFDESDETQTNPTIENRSSFQSGKCPNGSYFKNGYCRKCVSRQKFDEIKKKKPLFEIPPEC